MILLIPLRAGSSRHNRVRASVIFLTLLLTSLFSLQDAALAKSRRSKPQEQLRWAIIHHNAARIKAAVRHGAKLDPPGDWPALILLCSFDSGDFNCKIADLLVALGAHVNVQYDGWTPLGAGCWCLDDKTLVPMVKWFLAHGANADGIGDHRPISGVAGSNEAQGHYRRAAEAAALLIAHGAGLNVVDDDGNYPLSTACEPMDDHKGGAFIQEKLALLLIERGADVNVRNRFGGATPLMNLVDSNGIQIPAALRVARALLRHGARTDIKDSNGKTVLQLASENHLLAMVKLLEDYDRQMKQ